MNLEFGRVNRCDQKTYENPDWAPALSLRPHHFVEFEDVRAFLTGKSTSPDEHAAIKMKEYLEFHAKHIKLLGNDDRYENDVFGNSRETLEQYFRDEASFLTQLPTLPDASVILISLAPDGICKSCIVGNH